MTTDVDKIKAKQKHLISQVDARMQSRFMKGTKLPTLNIIASSKTSDQSFLDGYINTKKTNNSTTTLIVDEAHGALYPFSDNLPLSAVNIADFCIQSLHKTAGGINPTALLHSNCINPDIALKMISATSPSYPMLATIEANINYLNSTKGKKKISTIQMIL